MPAVFRMGLTGRNQPGFCGRFSTAKFRPLHLTQPSLPLRDGFLRYAYSRYAY